MIHFFKKAHLLTRVFFACFVILSAIAIAPVFAWTNPSSAPPTATPAISVSNGKVGIGTANPDTNYRLTTSGGGVKAETSSATQPAGYFNNTGGGSALTIGTGGITLNGTNRTSWGVVGSGATNYIPKFTAGTTLGNSSIFDNGNVGIGTTTPGAKLDVNGQIKITGGLPGVGRVLTSDANGLASWQNPSMGYWADFGSGISYTSGNVGIGTMYPTAMLEIYGGQIKITGGSPGVGKVLTSDANGLASWQNPAGGLSGSGTANYLTKWTAGSMQTNSIIVDDGLRVGIGTGSPQTRFHVNVATNQNIGFSSTSGEARISAFNDAASAQIPLRLEASEFNLLNGNVGIGTAAPGARLHVSGTSGYSLFESTTAGALGGLRLKNGVTDNYIGTNGARMYFYAGDATTEDMTISNNGNVGIGTVDPQSKLSVGGAGQSNATMYVAGGSGYGVYVGAGGTNTGIFIDSDSYGIDSRSAVAVRGIGSSVGGAFHGPTGIIVDSCSGCSVLAEMVPVAEDPVNGDIMCTDPDTGSVGICKEDKSRYIKGIAQKKAEQILRMGCSNTLDKKNGKNGMSIGVVDTDAWQKASECAGWYPIALSGLSEETNVVCRTPSGKALRYGDILVTSAVPGHLRPLDRDEDASAYQIAGKADSLCGAGKATDSIQVWVQ